MSFVENIIKRGKKAELQQPLVEDPNARRIDAQKHVLRFYPGFADFVSLWNGHIDSEERRAIREKLKEFEQPKEIVEDVPPDPRLVLEELVRNVEMEIETGGKTKEEMKKLRRDRRRVREKMVRLESGVEAPMEDTYDTRLEALRANDRNFAVGLEMGYAPIFYALEFCLGDQEACDQLFIQKVKRQESTIFKKELDLWGLNYSFNFMAREYYGIEGVTDEKDMRSKVDGDTQRQLEAGFYFTAPLYRKTS